MATNPSGSVADSTQLPHQPSSGIAVITTPMMACTTTLHNTTNNMMCAVA
jgi:hypothetical protein